MSTGHLSFVRSMRQRLPCSMPGQRPGTVGWGPPRPQSEHRRQSISSLRSLRFAAWYLAVPLAGGPERSTSSFVLAQAASSSAQRQWRSLGARSMLDARSFMISTLRSQVGFAAAIAHARLRLSRLELIGASVALAAPHRRPLRVCRASARAFISPTAFEQARGGALGAGGGRVGFAGGGLF